MKTRNSIKLITLFLSFILHFTIDAQEFVKVPAERVGISSERLKFLTNTFQEYVDNGKLSGAVALVSRKGQIAYFKSFGRKQGYRDGILQTGRSPYKQQ